jgi:hypothetical protein
MVPIDRATRIANQARAIWKLCLSFRKRKWELSDYPVCMRTQEPGPARPGSRFVLPRFVASVTNWHLSGTGDSTVQALESLQTTFAAAVATREAEGLPLPRPGTRVPIKFASQERVNAHSKLAEDFIHRILGFNEAWISDESSLWDFHCEETNKAYHAKIKETYGVDVSDIEPAKLCAILERIASTQGTLD